jgi:branched-chain amino acid transport system substrate-binding protein
LRVRWLAFLSCLLVVAFGVAACGDDEEEGGGGQASGNTLNLYSSLPLQGAQRLQTTTIVNGIKLALEQRNNKAGQFTIKYTSLDDSTAQLGTWAPEATSANARRVSQDDSAIAYIGEFNSGASAISIPILNEVPILQVSPANTAVGLTSDEPGADKGEPDKYYPSGTRHYARVVPKDTIQGAAIATIMKQDGCTTVGILNDKEVYGAGLARNIQQSAEEQGLTVSGNEGIDPKAPNFRSQASSLRGDNVDCFVFSGVTPNGAVQLYKDVAAALPDAKLYGPDGVSNPEFFSQKDGGLPPNVGNKVKVTVATLSPDEYTAEGQRFFDQYRQKYGVQNVDPYAIYGFEAASLILDSIEALGDQGSDRQALIDEVFNTKGRESVLGTYDIDENGDTTITDYGVYQVRNGELEFAKTVKAAG